MIDQALVPHPGSWLTIVIPLPSGVNDNRDVENLEDLQYSSLEIADCFVIVAIPALVRKDYYVMALIVQSS